MYPAEEALSRRHKTSSGFAPQERTLAFENGY